MTTTTALGLPVPSDTDPVSDGALAIRNLANALDVKKLRKAADQAVTNSAVMVNDDTLAFPVAAGKTYLFDIVMLVNSTVYTADIKTDFTFPAGGTLIYGVTGPDIAAASGTEKVTNAAVKAVASPSVSVSVGSGTDWVVRISGSYKNGGAAGTVQLRWAQNTATAAQTTRVLEGSTLRAEVI